MIKKKARINEEDESIDDIGDEIDQLFSSSGKELDNNIDRIFDVEQVDEVEMIIDLGSLAAELSELIDSGEKTIGLNDLKKIIEQHEVEEGTNED